VSAMRAAAVTRRSNLRFPGSTGPFGVRTISAGFFGSRLGWPQRRLSKSCGMKRPRR
jgi:hypothetical protein